jgi:predicted phosphodiesterase
MNKCGPAEPGGVPGRICPVSYRYDTSSFRETSLEVDTLWVAGGLYGNPFALERLLELYEREPGSKALVFNGDFHWFDVDPQQFHSIQESVERYVALRGNVETELAAPGEGAGCGCGYPEWVDDETVALSNRIIDKLRTTAQGFPRALAHLAALPMHRVAAVGGRRVALLHGDADSLAGWGFSQEALATAAGLDAAVRRFDESAVDIFASSHTCLPVLQSFPGHRVIANNGAAGMPNFRDTNFGLATRISVARSRDALYGVAAGSLFVEAVALRYDASAWEALFLAQWPEGSEAHRSYHRRIATGPQYGVEHALRAVPAGSPRLAAA